MLEVKSTNVVWHPKKVSLEDIEKRNGHKGCVIWLTGLSAAGKSTIAVEAEKQLFDMGCHVCLLDGDNVRQGLNKNLGFSPEDREENIRRIAELGKLLRNMGLIVITAFISPYKKERNLGRSLIEEGHFFETYINCSLDECIHRDPKGLYKKAIAGEIKEYTGISAPYEEPENPELILNTEALNVDECAKAIIEKLKSSSII